MTLPKVTYKLELNSLISRSFFIKVNTTKSTTDVVIILTQISNSLAKQLFPVWHNHGFYTYKTGD